MPVIPDETSVYGHVDENRHMIESFMDEKMPRENWNDSLFVVKLLMTCYMSAEKGKLSFPLSKLELHAESWPRNMDAERHYKLLTQIINISRKRVRSLSKRKYIIGVDLGGTWVRVALSDEKGKIIEKMREKVDISSQKAISSQIVKIVRILCNKIGVDAASLKGIGIASAGPLDIKEGALINPTNLPFDFVPLTRPISEQLSVPAFLTNDCTAAVLGEREFGAGRGLDNLVYITIGTGIGGGAIVDGHLLLGKDGNAVEIGHIIIDYERRLVCGCGKRGHWEAYCSGRNIPNYVRMRFKEISEETKMKSLLFRKLKGDVSRLSSQDLFDTAKNGDELSLQLVKEIGVLNSMGFANVINAYDPSLITVGGTVALKNEEFILPPIRKNVEKYAVNRIPEIIITPLREDVGIYGAIATVLKFKTQQ